MLMFLELKQVKENSGFRDISKLRQLQYSQHKKGGGNELYHSETALSPSDATER